MQYLIPCYFTRIKTLFFSQNNVLCLFIWKCMELVSSCTRNLLKYLKQMYIWQLFHKNKFRSAAQCAMQFFFICFNTAISTRVFIQTLTADTFWRLSGLHNCQVLTLAILRKKERNKPEFMLQFYEILLKKPSTWQQHTPCIRQRN